VRVGWMPRASSKCSTPWGRESFRATFTLGWTLKEVLQNLAGLNIRQKVTALPDLVEQFCLAWDTKGVIC
jgi:hypothetical protein